MKTLILIDLQKDFLPGGALAVNQGDEVIAVANQLMEEFDLVIATKDWHPQTHGSFAANHEGEKPGNTIDLNGLKQILWPVHCVQESTGSDFADDLNTAGIDEIFYKGTDVTVDSYSAFFDNARRRSTGLGDFLKAKGVEEIYMMGLATDYCVQFSALDAVAEGFKTHVILDGCRAVNLQEHDGAKAIRAMHHAGVLLRTLAD